MSKYKNDPDYGDYKMEEKRDFESVATEGSIPSQKVWKAFQKEQNEIIKRIKRTKGE